MKKLFVATGNKDKLREINDILSRNKVEVEILTPKDLDTTEEPDENGTTFAENAYIKARFYHDIVKMPTLADDSGICIDHLDGAPGIHSARFLPEMTYPQKNAEIIKMLEGVEDDRGARFVDCLCFIDKNGEVNYYTGINEGLIAHEPAGNGGFGYDPIFLIPAYNKTEAELGDDYKNEYSHRAKALKKWIIDAKDKI